jgi:hypothetical protein
MCHCLYAKFRVPSGLHPLPANFTRLLRRCVHIGRPLTATDYRAGYDATTYMNTFSILEKEQAIGKVVLLTTTENGEREAPLHTLPLFKLDSVFTSDKLPRMNRKLAPLNVGTSNNVTSNGGLISPQSPARSMGRLIDQSLVSAYNSCIVLSR